MAGSWAIGPRLDDASAGTALTQVVTAPPLPWHAGDDSLFPLTLIGAWNASFVDLSVGAMMYSPSASTPPPGAAPLLSLAPCAAGDASQAGT